LRSFLGSIQERQDELEADRQEVVALQPTFALSAFPAPPFSASSRIRHRHLLPQPVDGKVSDGGVAGAPPATKRFSPSFFIAVVTGWAGGKRKEEAAAEEGRTPYPDGGPGGREKPQARQALAPPGGWGTPIRDAGS